MAGEVNVLPTLADTAKELNKRLQGFFLFFLLVAVALVVIGIAAVGAGERIWLMASAAGLLLAGLIGFLIALPLLARLEQGVQQGSAQAEAQAREVAAATPTQLVAAPIAAAEVRQRTDLLIAPDGSFAFVNPGNRWRYTQTTLGTITAAEMAAQRLPASAQEIDAGLPFRAGPIVQLVAEQPHRIGYDAGTTVNGWPAVGLIDQDFSDTVLIFSVGRRGLAINDLTPEHLFAILVGGDTPLARVTQITRVPMTSPDGEPLTALSAHYTRSFERVRLDGVGPVAAAVETRLYVVERGYFLYVIKAAWLTGTPDQARTEADVQAIVDSVQITNAAGAQERIAQDEAATNAVHAGALPQVARLFLERRAMTLLRAVAGRGEPPRVEPGELADMRQLLTYVTAPTLRPGLDDAFVGWMQDSLAALEAAAAGDIAPLAALPDPPTPRTA